MARHKVPQYIEFTDHFPLNAAGKVLKYKMREEAALPKRVKNARWGMPYEDEYQESHEEQPKCKFTHEDKVEMWRLSKEEHLSYDKIAAKFKEEGKVTSRQNIGNYVNEIVDEKAKEAQP